jgi:L-seryl-tRNA(Ser) seleniumtransferase
VDEVLRALQNLKLPHALLKQQIRIVLDERRRGLLDGMEELGIPVEQAVEQCLAELLAPSLRPVINATGIILHTNLGRAPLASFSAYSGYTNLEYDLAAGKRGKRDVHTTGLLETLLGRPSLVVNNNAAAVYLVLNELAAGREVIVSRGELIEIGDGFRIPDIMQRSGAVLREVGTTNRTRLADYAAAISDRTALILRVHPSNFHIAGFTERPALQQLAALAREHNVPVFEDLGSGCVVDLRAYGVAEPLVQASFAAGAHLVSFSGDKLLGGPQAGIIAGDGELVGRLRRNPMYRAFRVDKLIIQALAATLRHLISEDWNAVPTLRMISSDLAEIRLRAERIAAALSESLPLRVRESQAAIGGGSTPDQTLPSWAVEAALLHPARFEAALRYARTPVIARIERDKVLFDMRTVSDDEESSLIASVIEAAANV